MIVTNAATSTYERNLKFTVFRDNKKLPSTFNDSLVDIGCSTADKLSVITHGWLENINTAWVADMIGNLTEVRGGCILFIDYFFYGQNPNYFGFLQHFASISAVMTKKFINIESEGFIPDNWFMFGHSAGARLIIDSAANFGYQKVKEIDGKI